MAYRQEKQGTGYDIVIDGWEKGMADSPELGIGSLQGANITSVPGEVSVSYATSASLVPPTGITSASFSAVAATDVVTVSSTAGYYPGMAIELLTTNTAPKVNMLLVAGGGAGAGTTNIQNTGGGGGGQVLPESNVSVTVGTYPIIVGVGGVSGSGGNNSSGLGFTATGGSSGLVLAGGASGSGQAGGAGNPGGGDGAGGGGGGDSATGSNGTQPGGNAQGGGGGAGTASSISGASVTYGGGGGGGAYGPSSSQGNGGTGGGGTGGSNTGGGGVVGATSGTANTGGGGGGAGGNTSPAAGASGGSGIVYISYPTGLLTATGGAITTSGGNTIHAFTLTGTTNWIVTAINPQANMTYYVGNISGNTFKLYTDLTLTTLANFISDTTGTYSIPSMAVPVWSAYERYYASTTSVPVLMTFILDNVGNCWYQPTVATTGTGGTVAANTIQYTGNIGHATTGTGADFGLVVWHDYLFVIVGRTIDYISIANLLSTAPTWTYAWKTNLTYTQYQHQAIAATDNAVYICNAGTLASIVLVSGSSFDPTNSSTYTYNIAALVLPYYDEAQSVAQLGTQLLIGGVLNYIYPWDRVSLQFAYPLICADSSIFRIVSTNSNAYVFAGTRGRIYICNAQQLQLYQEIPDSFSGNPEPYYVWQDAIYLRNKLYFTFTDESNAGSALNTSGGVWALGIDNGQTQIQLPTAGSLFNTLQLSYSTYGGSCPVLLQSLLQTPPGYGIGGAWVSGGVTGVDSGSSSPYTSFQTVIQTDIIPVGTYYNVSTDRQIEYKLSKPLVAGESVRISWRGNLASAFIPVWTSTATGQISEGHPVNFQKQQWVQLQVELSSTATNPSFVRLTELRIR